MFLLSSVSASTLATPPLGFPLYTTVIFIAAFIISMLIDFLQHKESHALSLKSSIGWSCFWIVLSLGFYAWLRFGLPLELEPNQAIHSTTYANLFLTGYVLEKVLSIDNLIVFIAIFKFFKIKDSLQHKILYFGILGAVIFRAIFVILGAAILHYAEAWASLIFGLLIASAAIKMLTSDDNEEEEVDYESLFLVKLFRKVYPIFPQLYKERFFLSQAEATDIAAKNQLTIKEGVKQWMTPAFVCLLVIEGSDVLFAFDSVPAVIAVTHEPLLVYSSMIFAILGLRALYFVLVVLTQYLVHLEKAVLSVLLLIAYKMFVTAYIGFQTMYQWSFILPEWMNLHHDLSMYIVLGMIALGILASIIFPQSEQIHSPNIDAP